MVVVPETVEGRLFLCELRLRRSGLVGTAVGAKKDRWGMVVLSQSRPRLQQGWIAVRHETRRCRLPRPRSNPSAHRVRPPTRAYARTQVPSVGKARWSERKMPDESRVPARLYRTSERCSRTWRTCSSSAKMNALFASHCYRAASRLRLLPHFLLHSPQMPVKSGSQYSFYVFLVRARRKNPELARPRSSSWFWAIQSFVCFPNPVRYRTSLRRWTVPLCDLDHRRGRLRRRRSRRTENLDVLWSVVRLHR